MLQICDKPIGNIHHRMDIRPERDTKIGAGLRQAVAVGQPGRIGGDLFLEPPGCRQQPKRGIADGSAHQNEIARPGGAAQHRLAPLNDTPGGNGNRDRAIGRNRIAAEKRDGIFALIAGKPCGKGFDPGIVATSRQRQGQQIADRSRRLGRQIGEIRP